MHKVPNRPDVIAQLFEKDKVLRTAPPLLPQGVVEPLNITGFSVSLLTARCRLLGNNVHRLPRNRCSR